MEGAIHWLRRRFCIKYPPARRRPLAPTPTCVAPLHVIAGSLSAHLPGGSTPPDPPLEDSCGLLGVDATANASRMHLPSVSGAVHRVGHSAGGAASSSSKAGRTSPTSPPACSRPDGDQRLIELPPNRPPPVHDICHSRSPHAITPSLSSFSHVASLPYLLFPCVPFTLLSHTHHGLCPMHPDLCRPGHPAVGRLHSLPDHGGREACCRCAPDGCGCRCGGGRRLPHLP